MMLRFEQDFERCPCQTDVFLPNEVEREEEEPALPYLCLCGPAGVVAPGLLLLMPSCENDRGGRLFCRLLICFQTLHAVYGSSVSVTRLGGASSGASLAEAEEVIRTGGTAFLEK